MLKQQIMNALIGLALSFFLVGGGALGPAAAQVPEAATHTASVHPYGWCIPPLPPC